MRCLKGLRENMAFWAAIILLAGLAPIVLLSPTSLTVALILSDLEAALILVCVWVEQQSSARR